LQKKLFSREPHRLDTLGSDHVVEKVDIAQLKKLASSWLVPNNACIALAGGFDKEAILDLVDQRFGQLPKAQNPWPTGLAVFQKPGVTRPTFLVFPDSSIPSGHMQIEIPTGARSEGDTVLYFAHHASGARHSPSSGFQTALRKDMPKGTGLQTSALSITDAHIPHPFRSNRCFRCRRGKIPPTLAFSFKGTGPQHRTLHDKGQRLIFSAAEYHESARVPA